MPFQTNLFPLAALVALSNAIAMPAPVTTTIGAGTEVAAPHSEPTKANTPDIFGMPVEHLLQGRQVDPTLASVDGASYIGCYENPAQNELLTMTRITDFNLTPELCRNLCQQEESAAYFGLNKGYYCYCGQQVESFAVSAAEEECDEPCRGATADLCGGSLYVGIYSMTSSVAAGIGGSVNTETVTLTTTNAEGSTVTTTAVTTSSAGDSGSDGSDSSGADDDNSGGSSGGSSSNDDGGTPIGAIVGGVVGGVAVIAIIAGIFGWMCFRRMRREVAEARAEAVAARQATANVSSGAVPMTQPAGGYYDQQQQVAKPMASSYTTPTPQYQQTPPPQPGTSPMMNQEYNGGYAQPPPQADGGITPPPPQQPQGPQELNDTARVHEMGNFYKR